MLGWEDGVSGVSKPPLQMPASQVPEGQDLHTESSVFESSEIGGSLRLKQQPEWGELVEDAAFSAGVRSSCKIQIGPI